MSATRRCRMKPAVMGKYFLRLRTSRIVSRSSTGWPLPAIGAVISVIAAAVLPSLLDAPSHSPNTPPSGPRRRLPGVGSPPGTAPCGTGTAGRRRSPCGSMSKSGGSPSTPSRPVAPRHVQARHRPQQPQRVGVRRFVVDLPGQPPLDDLPRVHDVDPPRVPRHHPQVVGDQDHRRPQLRAQPLDKLENLRLNGDVERRRGFVGDQELRVAAQRHGDHDPLPHAAAELVGVALEPLGAVGDAHHVQQLHGPATRFGTRSSPGAAPGPP